MYIGRKNVFEVLVIILFVSIVVFYRLPPTGQQVAGSVTTTTSSTTTTTLWPGNCDRPCPLEGGVGILNANNDCIDIKKYYDDKFCCINKDCGEGENCFEGKCQ